MFAPTRAPAALSCGECSTSARSSVEPGASRLGAPSCSPRRAAAPPAKALRRSGGLRGARVGRSRAVATMTPSRNRAESPSASPQRAAPQPLLFAGACAVEETALASALGTVVADERGTLKSRSLRYDSCSAETLSQAYDRCGVVTEDYGRTFYMATQLMTEQRRKAIWAIYGAPVAAHSTRKAPDPRRPHFTPPLFPVWCRRTDELVDGPNSPYITPAALDRWTDRLNQVFDGRPFDLLDAALTDTVASFPVDIQPFYDMVDGMRMDLVKSRYANFDELYEYCYRVAGTVALMSVPIMGIAEGYAGPTEPIYRAALALGLANQLTNILRDVGEDARTRGRIYLPLDDLAAHGVTEAEVINGTLVDATTGAVDERWKALMREQITRARRYFADAEAGVAGLDASARWPVWAALILYRQILDAIEANSYDNFTKRAYVSSAKKLLLLPVAFLKAAQPAAVSMPAAAMAQQQQRAAR